MPVALCSVVLKFSSLCESTVCLIITYNVIYIQDGRVLEPILHTCVLHELYVYAGMKWTKRRSFGAFGAATRNVNVSPGCILLVYTQILRKINSRIGLFWKCTKPSIKRVAQPHTFATTEVPVPPVVRTPSGEHNSRSGPEKLFSSAAPSTVQRSVDELQPVVVYRSL